MMTPEEPRIFSVAERVAEQKAQAEAAAKQSQKALDAKQSQFAQYQQEYISGRRNPIADLIKKPERDTKSEDRQKAVAIAGLFGDALRLIGKGYAASKGVKTNLNTGATTYRALGELKKLDDVYRADGYRYDHQTMLDTLRRKQSDDNLQQAQLGAAREDRNYDRSRAEKATQNELSYAMQQEQRATAASTQKEARAYGEQQADKEFYRRASLAKSNDQPQKGEPIAYYISDGRGGSIPIRGSDETEILQWAEENGVEYDKDVFDQHSDSPVMRTEIQKIYNTKQQAPKGKMPAPDAELSGLDRALLPILNNSNLTEQQKQRQIRAGLQTVNPAIAQQWLIKHNK